MKKIITPINDTQLAQWITTLESANVEYKQILNAEGKPGLLLNEEDAETYLNIRKLNTAEEQFKNFFSRFSQPRPAANQPNSSKGGCMPSWQSIIGLLVVLFIVGKLSDCGGGSSSDSKAEEKTQSTDIFSATPEAEVKISHEEQARLDSLEEVKTRNKLLERLEMEAASAIKFNGKESFRGSAQNLALEGLIFKEWAKLIRSGEFYSDPKIAAATKKLKKAAIAAQVREFPKMRKHAAGLLADVLWENNVTVTASGKGYTTLQYTGIIFADNMAIKKIQESLQETLNSLRFKRVNYFWSKYADDYSYYKVDTPKDSELITE